jgi:small subunit ribosomal protein S13
MINIFESKLPKNTSITVALRSVCGIGKYCALLFCKKLGFSINLKVKNLSKEQVTDLIKTIELSSLTIESDLKRLRLLQTKKLLSIKSYKGLRKNQGLPIRGQRTHTNARNARKGKYTP